MTELEQCGAELNIVRYVALNRAHRDGNQSYPLPEL
jgi:hypothetical protein